MAHLALICPPYASHLRVFESLAARLIARGHDVTFLLPPGTTLYLQHTAVDVCLLETSGSTRPTPGTGKRLTPALLQTVDELRARTDALCRLAPQLLQERNVDLVLGDQMEAGAGLVADHLQLPLISIASALPLDRDIGIPPPWLGWRYDPTDRGREHHRVADRISRWLMRRHNRTIACWAEQLGLAPRYELQDCISGVQCIAQTVPGLDFPRTSLSAHLAPVGPIRPPVEDTPPAVLDPAIDPARPLVYASLGTLQGHRLDIFRLLARACRRLDIQLIVSHCGCLTPEQAATIDATRVEAQVPQPALLKHCDICITHGGLNTVMDALSATVPVLAIPLAFDQPGIAARLVHHELGLRLTPRQLSLPRLTAALTTLLTQSGYRRRALSLSREIAGAGGAVGAVAHIEHILQTRGTGPREALAGSALPATTDEPVGSLPRPEHLPDGSGA
ncbi:MGT family glycosyltransferase [Kushneria sinocarnis]|uniref:MGT family glycosyltransferase n=1 Tax=Kushneria sinocarnis TaxID=595502 RepID=A0A420WZK3_9GAMM|nr:glycosyltransferase [Kushneria sinocarnis]RKR06788.1 MGT family glycosyltransferase [Kushneria sinocarnis]